VKSSVNNKRKRQQMQANNSITIDYAVMLCHTFHAVHERREVVGQQDDGRCVARNVGAGVHRNAHVRLLDSWGIVDSCEMRWN
jgi:hypothetical protein